MKLLSTLASGVERRPVIALIVFGLLTVVLGSFAGQQQADADLTAFAPESELADAYFRATEEFGETGATTQVIVDAGPEGDVLSPTGLEAAGRIARVAQDTPELAEMLAPSSAEDPAVLTFALPFAAALAQQGLDPATADATVVDQLAAAMLSDPETAAQAGALLSQDRSEQPGVARAGLVVIQLDPDVHWENLIDGELALVDALGAEEFGELEVTPFSERLMADSMLTDVEREVPILLGAALLLIVAILTLTYRRLSDVLLGLAGLLVVVVWTYGIAVLLGPDYLGITGVLTQVSLMIPVLLVGLAIDYAIHLTLRYREELTKGGTPTTAARAAIVSVGGALVLATITTMVGFLTNLVSPLPPMRDFGLFVAGGVLSAFAVMLLLVPAARSLLDRRAAARDRLRVPASGSASGPGRIMAKAALVSERRPGTTLLVAAAVTVVAAGAGSQVSTTFSQEDFIPEDSEIAITIDTMLELFGGDLAETTTILLEGDLASPEAANAMFETQQRLADTENVRSTGGQVQAGSPAAVVAALAADPQAGTVLADLGFEGTGFAPDADVAAMYDLAWQVAPQLIGGVLSEDGSLARVSVPTVGGQENAVDLRDALLVDADPLTQAGLDVTVVSEPLLMDETLDALTASQTRQIGITLLIALLVPVAFFTIRDRKPLLGVITMIPATLVVAWTAGSMLLLGMSFNVMTAMVASLAIGIGVPYGIHIANRFAEDWRTSDSIDDAVRRTVTNTGGALLGSAATTASGFGVLAFASLIPIQQFGIITALTIIYSLIAAVLVEPACLKLWAQWRERRDGAPEPVPPPVEPQRG